jgi:hypothetical protein
MHMEDTFNITDIIKITFKHSKYKKIISSSVDFEFALAFFPVRPDYFLATI